MPRYKEFNEDEVLKKAMLLFWKKGYHSTSIKDLIKHLNISNASIYNTFGGKKQLFDRALKRYRDDNLEGMNKFLKTQTDARSALRKIFVKVILEDQTDVDCKGCFIVNTTTEMIPEDNKIKASMHVHRKLVEGHLQSILQMGVEKGQIDKDKDIRTLSKLLYTFLNGLRVNGKSKPKVDDSLATVDTILSLLD